MMHLVTLSLPMGFSGLLTCYSSKVENYSDDMGSLLGPNSPNPVAIFPAPSFMVQCGMTFWGVATPKFTYKAEPWFLLVQKPYNVMRNARNGKC